MSAGAICAVGVWAGAADTVWTAAGLAKGATSGVTGAAEIEGTAATGEDVTGATDGVAVGAWSGGTNDAVDLASWAITAAGLGARLAIVSDDPAGPGSGALAAVIAAARGPSSAWAVTAASGGTELGAGIGGDNTAAVASLVAGVGCVSCDAGSALRLVRTPSLLATFGVFASCREGTEVAVSDAGVGVGDG